MISITPVKPLPSLASTGRPQRRGIWAGPGISIRVRQSLIVRVISVAGLSSGLDCSKGRSIGDQDASSHPGADAAADSTVGSPDASDPGAVDARRSDAGGGADATTADTPVGDGDTGQCCTAGGDCKSGFCVDGVCCNSACNGVCSSCLARDNGQPADGTCAAVTAGTDPANECAAGAATCGLDGFCGGGKCRFAPATVSCMPAVCTEGANDTSATLASARSCDGAGNCPTTSSTTACPGSVRCASASACKPAGCVVDVDCLSGFYCAAGACKAKGALGAACAGATAGNQCASNNCSSDSVCCSTACTDSCLGCKLASNGLADGTCAPRPSTAACNGACGAGYSLCLFSNRCVITSWNFDQGEMLGTTYGWFSDDGGRFGPPLGIPFSTISLTAGAGHGSQGIQRPVIDGGSIRTVDTSPCDDGTTKSNGMDLRGQTMTAWVLRSTPSPIATPCRFIINFLNGGMQDVAGVSQVGTAANTWFKVSGVVPNTTASSSVKKFGLSCEMAAGWDGTLWFDEVSVSP
jgi:hypothetical protein